MVHTAPIGSFTPLYFAVVFLNYVPNSNGRLSSLFQDKLDGPRQHLSLDSATFWAVAKFQMALGCETCVAS